MISPVTWLWNIRHRKLIEEAKDLIRLQLFLKEVGLKENLPAKGLEAILCDLKQSKMD